MALNVSRNKVPVIINFPTYPQLLAYPKMAEQRTSTSVAFDMTRPLTFNNLLLWVLSALGWCWHFVVVLFYYCSIFQRQEKTRNRA